MDPDPDSMERLLIARKTDLVTYDSWEAIDHAEKTAGAPQGRPRVKHTTYDDLVAAAKSGGLA